MKNIYTVTASHICTEDNIKRHEIGKETKCFYFINRIDRNGMTYVDKCGKDNWRYNFFDTFEEARDYCLNEIKKSIKEYEEHIKFLNDQTDAKRYQY